MLITLSGGRRQRTPVRLAAVLIAVTMAVSLTIGATPLAAQEAAMPFAGVELPPDLGQSSRQVFVPETEHTLRGSMLDYWRANGTASVYGNPISEPFAAANGRYSQAFENGVFQFYAELIWTDLPMMRLMPISETALNQRVGNMRRDGRRDAGGGDRRDYAWRPVAPNGNAAARAISGGGIYAEATAHTVVDEFLDWYAAHEGASYLGDPVSQPVKERGMTVQYFEGGLLMRDDNGRMSLAPLAAEQAEALGIDTSPVEKGSLQNYRESLFVTKPNPNPIGDLSAPGKRWIEVSISQQTLWAYQGETLVARSLVSTGVDPNPTERGLFHVRLKYPKQDMQGFTDETGEVVSVGDDNEDAPRGSLSYDVEDVPSVMYINADAEALHGASWHNNFGNRMSHGCINLPLDFAAFLYGWAPIGTLVWVHD